MRRRRNTPDSEHVFRLYRELGETERAEFDLLVRGAAIASAKPLAPEKREPVRPQKKVKVVNVNSGAAEGVGGGSLAGIPQ